MTTVTVATAIIAAFLAALTWFGCERSALPSYVVAFLSFLVLLLCIAAGPALLGGR
jgi:hypothetical protein